MSGSLVRERGADGLKFSAGFWFAAMLLGQWAFFYYIAAFYGGSMVSGDFEVWNRLGVFGRRPYIPGDTAGNLAFLGHALGAGYVALAGALQLVPQIRSRFPTFHRWNGRLFLLTVVVLSLSGFYMVWIRSSEAVSLDSFVLSLNGVLILGFAAATWRAVRRRDIAAHREWAMRLYLVSNAQWFMRVGFFSYFLISTAMGRSPSSAFFHFWKFGCFLVPLAMLQLYFMANRSKLRSFRIATSSVLVVATLAMLLGTAAYGGLTYKLITGAPIAGF